MVVFHFGIQRFLASAVVEEGDMGEFLSLGQPELLETEFEDAPTKGMLHMGGADKKILWKGIVLIVLRHTCDHHVWTWAAVKVREVVCKQSGGELKRAIRTEVGEDARMTVPDGGNGLAVAGDYESG